MGRLSIGCLARGSNRCWQPVNGLAPWQPGILGISHRVPSVSCGIPEEARSAASCPGTSFSVPIVGAVGSGQCVSLGTAFCHNQTASRLQRPACHAGSDSSFGEGVRIGGPDFQLRVVLAPILSHTHPQGGCFGVGGPCFRGGSLLARLLIWRGGLSLAPGALCSLSHDREVTSVPKLQALLHFNEALGLSYLGCVSMYRDVKKVLAGRVCRPAQAI